MWTCAEPRISGSNEWPIPLYHFSNSVLFLGLLPKIPKTAIKISFCFKWIHFVRKAMFNIFTISLFQSYSWKNVVSIAIFYTPNILQLQMTVDSQKKEHEMSFFLKLFLTLLKSCNNVSILFLCLFSVKHRDSCLSMWTLVVLGIRTQWRLAATIYLLVVGRVTVMMCFVSDTQALACCQLPWHLRPLFYSHL